MAKTRKKIPENIAIAVMFKANQLCCICEKVGHHIHHIDENPANNDFDNLVFLCFEHHDEVTRKGGLSRQLNPSLLRKYRASLYEKIEVKRRIPEIAPILTANGQINEDYIFQFILDAVSVREIQKIRRSIDLDDKEKLIEAVYELSSYIDSSGLRARKEILIALDSLTFRTRLRMPTEAARVIAHVAYEALPIQNQHSQSKTPITDAEIELIQYGLEIGVSLSYEGALRVKDIKIVDVGSELLWKILRYARINKHEDLQQSALQYFDIAEDGAKRGGDSDALTLVQLYREHGISGDWNNPIYGEHLLDRIS